MTATTTPEPLNLDHIVTAANAGAEAIDREALAMQGKLALRDLLRKIGSLADVTRSLELRKATADESIAEAGRRLEAMQKAMDNMRAEAQEFVQQAKNDAQAARDEADAAAKATAERAEQDRIRIIGEANARAETQMATAKAQRDAVLSERDEAKIALAQVNEDVSTAQKRLATLEDRQRAVRAAIGAANAALNPAG